MLTIVLVVIILIIFFLIGLASGGNTQENVGRKQSEISERNKEIERLKQRRSEIIQMKPEAIANDGYVLYESFYLRGTQYNYRYEYILENVNEFSLLDLVNEYDNPHSSEAIMVVHEGTNIGYVAKEKAYEVQYIMDMEDDYIVYPAFIEEDPTHKSRLNVTIEIFVR